MQTAEHRAGKKEVLNVGPGAAHVPIWVKLNPQVYSMQQQITAKLS